MTKLEALVRLLYVNASKKPEMSLAIFKLLAVGTSHGHADEGIDDAQESERALQRYVDRETRRRTSQEADPGVDRIEGEEGA